MPSRGLFSHRPAAAVSVHFTSPLGARPPEGEHPAPAQLLALLDHHHALVPLLQEHARPLVPPRQRHRGIVAGTLKRLTNKKTYQATEK